MGYEDLLQCLQTPDTEQYSKPDQSSGQPYIVFL
jgi:hypothetical protein